jgi:outer membrane biosynthesis protein TonB
VIDLASPAPGIIRRHSLAMALAVGTVLSARAGAQEPIVPLATRWPARIAVAMSQGQQLSPLTVEARRDGWVVVTILSTRPDEGLAPPSMRLIAEARDVRRWTAQVRRMLSRAGDSTARPLDYEAPSLGSGRFRFETTLHFQQQPRRAYFAVYGCGPGSASAQPSFDELRELLDLLDSAATRAGGGSGRPPTLRRPYYGSEVSCPASPLPGNAPITLPNEMPGSERHAEIGVRFVVDTAGRVEAGSIQLLPGTDRRLARAARETIATWRFRPAQWDALPVRQLVQNRVVGSRGAGAAVADRSGVRVAPDANGWVRFAFTLAGMPSEKVVQEWVTPDSVDAWILRVDSLNAEADSLRSARPQVERLIDKGTQLGSSLGIRYGGGYFAHGKAVESRAGVVFCGGASVTGVAPVDSSQLARFRLAARAARAMRATPVDPASGTYSATDVACPAWLPWHRSIRHDSFRVWQYPTGVYPASMAAANARAEVLASFVVDSAGVVDLSTLAVMPRSDPRAVDALPASLRALRFRPATRGGRRVAQRVIQSILFEPPPVCLTSDAGPACGPRYSTDLDADKPAP